MKRKWFVCMMVLLLLLTATACGGNTGTESTPVSDGVPPVTTTTTATTTTTTIPTTSKPTMKTITVKPTTTTTTTTTTAKPTTTTTTAPPEELIRLGTVEGNRYESPFLGIGCTLPEDWVFATDEDIREMNEITPDMDEKEISDYLKIVEHYYDVMAVSQDGCYMDGTVEPLSEEFLTNVDMEEFFAQNVAPYMGSRLRKLGCTNQQTWKSMVTIDGTEYPAAVAFGLWNGTPIYDITVGIPIGTYLYGLTVTAYEQQTALSILQRFYFL